MLVHQTLTYSLLFHVEDAPVCISSQKTVYKVSKLTSVHIVCEVEANPSSTLAFRWQFNTSANIMNIPVGVQLVFKIEYLNTL